MTTNPYQSPREARHHQLIEGYRERAARMQPADFCRHALGNGVTRLDVALLLRDLYGFNLEECKILIGACETDGQP